MKNNILTTDWSPAIEATTRTIATLAAVAYVAGLALGHPSTTPAQPWAGSGRPS